MSHDVLIENLKRARRARGKHHGFGFIMEGADGLPILHVDKRPAVVIQQTKKARRSAVDKKVATGIIDVGDDGTMTLVIQEGNAKPKQVHRALTRRLAKAPELKKVKNLLMALEVREGPLPSGTDPDEPETGDDSPEERLQSARDAAKQAYQSARPEVAPEVLAELDALKSAATQTRKSGDVEASISAYDALTDAALDALAAARQPDSDEEATIRVEDAHAQLLDALATVDDQLQQLAGALRNADHPGLLLIAERGLSGLTRGHRTALIAPLLEALGSDGPHREACLERLADAAQSARQWLDTDPRIAAIDSNPFGVTCTLKRELGSAFDQLASL